MQRCAAPARAYCQLRAYGDLFPGEKSMSKHVNCFSTSYLRAPMSMVAARGLSKPAMSLMARVWMPCSTICSASFK